jgi:hypothetical protein
MFVIKVKLERLILGLLRERKYLEKLVVFNSLTQLLLTLTIM